MTHSKISDTLDRGQLTIVFFYLVKAFDTVNQEILIDKLRHQRHMFILVSDLFEQSESVGYVQ